MGKKHLKSRSNISDSVAFLMDGAKKRRKIALDQALSARGELNIRPNLTAVK